MWRMVVGPHAMLQNNPQMFHEVQMRRVGRSILPCNMLLLNEAMSDPNCVRRGVVVLQPAPGLMDCKAGKTADRRTLFM